MVGSGEGDRRALRVIREIPGEGTLDARWSPGEREELVGGGVVRQCTRHSALATRSRSTAGRRYSSVATATTAWDQVRTISVKFIDLMEFRVAVRSIAAPRAVPRAKRIMPTGFDRIGHPCQAHGRSRVSARSPARWPATLLRDGVPRVTT